MEQIFILGRNPVLSREEIFAYLKSRNQIFEEVLFNGNFLILKVRSLLDVQRLGGAIRSGEVLFAGDAVGFENFLNIREIVPSDKFSYSIFGNGEFEILKDKFKREKKKAVLKQGRKNLRIQDGDALRISSLDYNLFFYNHKGKIFFGHLNNVFNYTEIKKRDMEKPFRREELAISPRLAKILINLSGAKEGETILDPFCGIGGILLEGLSGCLNVVGVDKDRNAVERAKKNIEWLTKNYSIKNRYTLVNQDSKKIKDIKFDAVATEAPLGELLKRKPSRQESKKIISDFEEKIIPVLKRLSQIKRKEVKIAMTFPVVGGHGPDEKRIAEKCGLEILLNPVREHRPDQRISREVVIFR